MSDMEGQTATNSLSGLEPKNEETIVLAGDKEKGDHLTHRPSTRRRSSIAEALESPHPVEDAESLVSISGPPSPEEVEEAEPSKPPSPTYHQFSIHVIASLMPTSVLGLLARLGLQAITTYDGRAIFPLAWVQAAGCFVMGFALGLREPLGDFYAPVYTGITSGFCGSLTTFSSWQLDVFQSWANATDSHRDWFRDAIDGLSKTLFTLAISLSAVKLGEHISRPLGEKLKRRRLKPVRPLARNVSTVICILMYFATIPIYFKLSPAFRHQATAAMLFSFPGTLTRYVLAMKATPLLKLFPLGTFLANVIATALIGAFHVLQRHPHLPGPNACTILQGLMDGYCGCLSTISTFAVEIGVLDKRKAWFYVALSWSVGQLLLLVILGPSWWAGGVKENVTCSFA